MEVDGAEKGQSKEWVDVGLEKDEGRSSMAQILGFKFVYYQVSSFRARVWERAADTSRLQQKEGVEETPEKLYLLAGLLIYNGFIKLADLWPHVSYLVALQSGPLLTRPPSHPALTGRCGPLQTRYKIPNRARATRPFRRRSQRSRHGWRSR